MYQKEVVIGHLQSFWVSSNLFPVPNVETVLHALAGRKAQNILQKLT